MRSHHFRRGTLALLGIALIALTVAACGDDDSDKGGKSSDQRKLEVTLGANGKLSGFQGAESGLTQISFTNDAKQKYDLQLVRIDGTHPLAEILKVVASDGPTPIPTWLHGAGGVGTTDPGKTGTVTQLIDGGNYYLVADPDQNGKHVTAKMTVSGGKATGELPTAASTVTASEYKFTTSGLKSGLHKLEFENGGRELHHAIFVPLKQGATIAQAKKFFVSQGNSGGPPPFDETRNGPSTTVLDPGQKQVLDVKLDPGKYALVCFISDRKGGPPHVAKGMITEVNVS